MLMLNRRCPVGRWGGRAVGRDGGALENNSHVAQTAHVDFALIRRLLRLHQLLLN